MTKTNDNQKVLNRLVSKGIFPHQWAFTLLIPLRNIFLSPQQLLNRLELPVDAHVLEVGSGPGYFAVPVAKRLTQGKLVLADIQPEMLNYARKRISKKKLSNVEYYICDGSHFNFPDNTFRCIYMITVMGEIEHKSSYINEFYRMLQPGGILSISEMAGDPDKLTAEEIKDLVYASGFSFYRLFGNKRNYTINFLK